MRRPLRRRDPLSASASVGNSVVRNRLVRPTKKPGQVGTVSEDELIDAVTESSSTTSTNPPFRRLGSATRSTTTTTPAPPQTTTQKIAFQRPSRRPGANRKSGTSTALLSNSNNNNNRPVASDADKGYKIVCYFTNWAQYRPKTGKYLPEDIDPHLCTHIIYAFGWMKKGKLSSLEANDESVDGKVGLYERMMSLKNSNPDLKVLLAIGQHNIPVLYLFFSCIKVA